MTGGKAFLIAVALVAGCAVASAQEEVGAGILEVGGGAGGVYWVGGDDNTEVNFNDMEYHGGVTWYLNPMVAIAGEGQGGIGIAQNVVYLNRKVLHNMMPNLVGASGNILVFPAGSRREFAPYVAGGVGMLTLLSRYWTSVVDFNESQSFFTTNVGGGLKYFRGGDVRNWGWQGDYRLIMVNKNSDAVPFFARSKRRMGHRISLNMFYTLRR